MQKSIIKKLTALLLALLCVLAFASCGAQETPANPPAASDADYGEPMHTGEGTTQFIFRITAEDKKTQYLVYTDAKTVGEALLATGLIAGTTSAGSLMVTTVCGTTLDYEKDGAYWAFHINGEYATAGVSETTITPDTIYEFAYTKA